MSPGRRPAAARALLLLPLAALAGSAHALGLGEISEQSAFGTSLRVVVPVIAGTAAELTGECVRLVTAGRSTDGIPEVREARIAVERTTAGARIVVTSPRGVTDPVLKLTLQAGCDSIVRREYVLLMDPLPIDVPVAQQAAPQRSAVATRPRDGARLSAEGPAASAVAAPAAASPAPGARSRRRATSAAAAARATRPAAAPGSATAKAKSAPSKAAAPAARPRLTVSAAAPPADARVPGKGPPTVPAEGAPAPGATPAPLPAPAALDAQAVALQQRVAELTAIVDRLQQEIRAADALQAAQAARVAAENAASTSPQAMLGRWWNEGWPLLVVVVVALAALIAVLLSYRRRRATAADGQWRLEAPLQRTTEPPRRPNRAAPLVRAAPPRAVGAASTGPQVTAPGTASTVDVSELSPITEEAGVYLAFNRPDRAVDVLREHVRTYPNSLPAAWLMLLDLYHGQGREPEFRDLAERFHVQFNAVAPSWDTYRRQAQEDRGLEAFPRLVEQLVAAWGKPQCHEFLDRLLRDNRDGRRTGFSLAAYEDILFLRQLAEAASGDGSVARALQRPAAAVAPRAGTRLQRAPTLDLELALDDDMLDADKSRSPGAAAPPPAPDPPKER